MILNHLKMRKYDPWSAYRGRHQANCGALLRIIFPMVVREGEELRSAEIASFGIFRLILPPC